METTYEVKIYKILTYKGARKSTYTVRRVVAGKRWREPFDTVALAEDFRFELITAVGKGEAFVIATGLPVSHRSKSAAMSWYKFAVEYVDARWTQLAGNSRKNLAKTLTATTVALLRVKPAQFEPAAARTALREWAFNTNRRGAAPRDVENILRWVERNSLPVSAWEDPDKVEEVLRALDTPRRQAGRRMVTQAASADPERRHEARDAGGASCGTTLSPTATASVAAGIPRRSRPRYGNRTQPHLPGAVSAAPASPSRGCPAAGGELGTESSRTMRTVRPSRVRGTGHSWSSKPWLRYWDRLSRKPSCRPVWYRPIRWRYLPSLYEVIPDQARCSGRPTTPWVGPGRSSSDSGRRRRNFSRYSAGSSAASPDSSLRAGVDCCGLAGYIPHCGNRGSGEGP
ncbi:hypothetical protein [Streptomyces nodosus]|uniref:hypothetical protein n=1 Tax=Streptomyces nodosus TaxID=40318 RepID=UPI0017A825A7|nr:hypothetical protein [Streptomyces nodosus]MBB4794333.1 hypothetical protein [Streptomyces nodosus]